MSSRSSSNVGCVVQETGETGVGWLSVRSYIDNCRPRMILLENVVGLLAENDDGQGSDADFILSQLELRGYHVEKFVYDAREFGSYCARKRLYITATLRARSMARTLTPTVLQGVQCGPGDYKNCLWVDPEALDHMTTFFPDDNEKAPCSKS